MKYYVIENQIRDDGEVNQTVTARQNRNSALSFFHERLGKMYMTELYPSVVIAVYDENMAEVERKIVDTMYPQTAQPEAEESVEV